MVKSEERSANDKDQPSLRPIYAHDIAPCGMNCRLCRAYVRERNRCPGCRGDDSSKPKTRVVCGIKTCERLSAAGSTYCLGCGGFPCASLKQLDKRYRTKYGMSMIDNLESIGKHGMEYFAGEERNRWTCPGCGKILCVHEPRCLSCGREWR